ncbi:drug/metabolite transporter (DMT)-like permease [Desulfobotulus alkaliphilus]|uniref:Drug/metabolite transporter (DMT)-like permease n=1 Tax=Desulfobotulus alkaliphilus TaxID=622671 RepID=A0A562S1Z8_9BACT|nr:EamA family transporter [Desulfobotulus alkaliphilus]TWI75322.1 drug/metabolite transporter (DMT)-like permease [Desulfobotulus alkaliphilus]
MRNLLFYTFTVLIWGSTWIAITFQLGDMDPMASVALRFCLASFLLLIFCFITRIRMRFSPKEHMAMALQGFFLFGLNYWFIYLSELHITSGLAAVLFSTIVLMNVINAALFLGNRIRMEAIWAAVLGLTGIVLVFRPELEGFHLSDSGLKGALFCLAGTWLASIGNILSARNQKKSLPIIQTNAFGMGYGGIVMVVFSIALGKSLIPPFTFSYMGSLFYLAVFGSILAFGCYLSLVGSIGPEKAAYATLLFPIVALGFSTFLEDYQWSLSAASGVGLILAGNFLMMRKKKNPEKESKILLLPEADTAPVEKQAA